MHDPLNSIDNPERFKAYPAAPGGFYLALCACGSCLQMPEVPTSVRVTCGVCRGQLAVRGRPGTTRVEFLCAGGGCGKLMSVFVPDGKASEVACPGCGTKTLVRWDHPKGARGPVSGVSVTPVEFACAGAACSHRMTVMVPRGQAVRISCTSCKRDNVVRWTPEQKPDVRVEFVCDSCPKRLAAMVPHGKAVRVPCPSCSASNLVRWDRPAPPPKQEAVAAGAGLPKLAPHTRWQKCTGGCDGRMLEVYAGAARFVCVSCRVEQANDAYQQPGGDGGGPPMVTKACGECGVPQLVPPGAPAFRCGECDHISLASGKSGAASSSSSSSSSADENGRNVVRGGGPSHRIVL